MSSLKVSSDHKFCSEYHAMALMLIIPTSQLKKDYSVSVYRQAIDYRNEDGEAIMTSQKTLATRLEMES